MASRIQETGGRISGGSSGAAGRRNLTVVSAAVSVGIVAYDLKKASADRTAIVHGLGATVLLWGLIFVLGEFSPELGGAVAVFVLLVFLVARQGAVSALLGAFGSSSSRASPTTPATAATAGVAGTASAAVDQVQARAPTTGAYAPTFVGAFSGLK